MTALLLGSAAPAVAQPAATLMPAVPMPPGLAAPAPGFPVLPSSYPVGSYAGPPAVQPGPLRRFAETTRDFRRELTDTPGGQILNRLSQPVSRLTGGLIPPLRPVQPSLRDLLDPGPVGAAAKFAVDEATADKRIRAVRELAKADCRYWPEAEDALAGALRGDRNEAVRYEAAVVLANGCCCTAKTLAALDAAVSGTERDGFPAECSVRVRCAAGQALERCLARCPTTVTTTPPTPPDPASDEKPAPNADPQREGASRRPAPTPAQVAAATHTLTAFRELVAAATGAPPSPTVTPVPPVVQAGHTSR